MQVLYVHTCIHVPDSGIIKGKHCIYIHVPDSGIIKGKYCMYIHIHVPDSGI